MKDNFKFYCLNEPLLIYTLTPHEDEELVVIDWNMEDEALYTFINDDSIGQAIWKKEEVEKLISNGQWIVVEEGDDE